MKRCFFGILMLVSFLTYGQYKAEEFVAALLEAKYGAFLVYNGKTNSFSIRIEAESIKTTDKPNFIFVDNVLIQSSLLPFNQELVFNNLDKESKKRLLTSWKVYEKKWVEEQLKIKLIEKEEFIDISDNTFLYWGYSMPKSKKEGSVDGQVYLVTICFDQLLVLSGPVEKAKNEEIVKNKLLSIAETLTFYPNKTQDIEKLYYELKK